MAVPGLPLADPVIVGNTTHAALHTGADQALNYLGNTSQAVNTFLAAPSGAPGAADFRAITYADIAAALLLVTGNVNFSSTGQRLLGDFSNATITNRLLVKTNVVNGATTLALVPNGTGVASVLAVYNAEDPTNAGVASFAINASQVIWSATRNGAGTFLPMIFTTSGATRMGIDINGLITLGSSGGAGRVTIVGTTDIVQEIIKAHSTQTADIAEWQTSAAAVLVKINGAGLFFPVQFTTGGTPAWSAALKGAIIYDTTLQKLRVAGNAAWETVTSV